MSRPRLAVPERKTVDIQPGVNPRLVESEMRRVSGIEVSKDIWLGAYFSPAMPLWWLEKFFPAYVEFRSQPACGHADIQPSKPSE